MSAYSSLVILNEVKDLVLWLFTQKLWMRSFVKKAIAFLTKDNKKESSPFSNN